MQSQRSPNQSQGPIPSHGPSHNQSDPQSSSSSSSSSHHSSRSNNNNQSDPQRRLERSLNGPLPWSNDRSAPQSWRWMADLVAMDDASEYAMPCSPRPDRVYQMYLCTCFLFVAPTPSAIALMDDWAARMEQFAWKHVNQFAFNLAIATVKRPLKVRTLDRVAFPSGNVWNIKDEVVRNATRANRLVVHANFVTGSVSKWEMLRAAGFQKSGVRAAAAAASGAAAAAASP